MRRAIDPGPRRVLIAELDSHAQAQQFLAYRADLPARFAGYLRSASFLAEEVAVTDVQLLDGVLPLRLGPVRFRELLALHKAGAGFLVLGRAEDVTGCLRMIAADEKTGMMRPFEWSCLTQFSLDPRAVAGNTVAVVRAQVAAGRPKPVADREVSQTKWVPVAQLPDLIADGTLRDGLTLAALAKSRYSIGFS